MNTPLCSHTTQVYGNANYFDSSGWQQRHIARQDLTFPTSETNGLTHDEHSHLPHAAQSCRSEWTCPELRRNEPAVIACGHASLAETPRRNVHHAKRHELNGRTGAACPTFQLLGTPWESSEVDGKVPASLPAHSPHTAPRLLRRSPFTCPKVENASQRGGNEARNPARSPLEALGGDASPPQRSPSARADDHTPA